MRFHLSDIPSYKGKHSEQNQTKAESTNHADRGIQNAAGQSVIKLVPGSTISGQVVSVEGNTICLKLTNDIEITAKLERNMEIAVGQRLTLDVNSIGNGQLSLRPLFANTAVSSTMMNGLSAANIPITENSISMISEMMNKGMSIDKNSLQIMHRNIMNFSETKPTDIVLMNALKIPITAENIVQFEAYKNFEGQITNSILELADTLKGTCLSLINSGNEEQVVSIYKQVIPMLLEGSLAAEGTALKDNTLMQEESTSSRGSILQANAELVQKIVQAENLEGASHNLTLPDTEGRENHVPENLTISKERVFLENNMNLSEDEKSIASGQPIQSESKLALANYISESNRILISDLLIKSGLSSVLAEVIKSGKISMKEFHNILTDKLTAAFLLKPQEVGEDGKVSRLYERMSEQIQKLTNTLTTIGQEGSSLFQAAKQLSGSVEFMNQLNHNFQYVQLPLKFHNETGQGDLYVYTNKRNLAQSDGTISALLHLDMEHLGPVDVYVSMTNAEHLNTKFYLRDEEMLQFIESRLDLLNERLKKRGYDMKSEVVMSNGGKKDFSQLLVGENQNSQTLLSTQSFDVRA